MAFFFAFQNFSLHIITLRAAHPRMGIMTNSVQRTDNLYQGTEPKQVFVTEGKRRQILLWIILTVSVLRRDLKHLMFKRYLRIEKVFPDLLFENTSF